MNNRYVKHFIWYNDAPLPLPFSLVLITLILCLSLTFTTNLSSQCSVYERNCRSISRFLQINLTDNQIRDNKNTYSNKKQSAEGDQVEQMVLGNRGNI